MPTRPNLGYAAAMGVEGGFESLHKIIAARQKQEEEAQLQRLRDEAAALAQRRLDEDVQYRETQQQQQVLDRQERTQYQRDQLERLRLKDEADAENRDIDNYRAALDKTTGGTVFDEQGYQRAVKVGYGPMFKRKASDHALAPAQYEFAGGTEWQKSEADRKSREEQKALDRAAQARADADRAANTRAIADLARAGQDEKGWTLREDDSPEGASYYKPGQERRPLPAGSLVGAKAARAAKAAEEIMPIVSSLRSLKEVGEQYKWEGVGPTSTWQAGLQALGLHTPTEAATKVRTALGNARSLIAHTRYGAALTEGEKEILNTFVATIDTNGIVTSAMVDEVLRIELDLMRDVSRGAKNLYEEMRPTPKAETPDVASIRPYLPSLTTKPKPTTTPPTSGGLKILGMK